MESRKMAQMNYSQCRNRETDVKKTYGGEIYWEVEIDIYTLLCIKH